MPKPEIITLLSSDDEEAPKKVREIKSLMYN